MKANHPELWLTLSLLLALGCGARTPLDDWEPGQSGGPVAGGTTSQGGAAGGTSASLGGNLAAGGQGYGDSRGGQFATGGQGGSGGTTPSGGSLVGGRGGSSGATVSGGTATTVSGGTLVGGRGGSGGTTTTASGGTLVGGRGGSGGTTVSGGSLVGGRGGSGGTTPSGGSLVGGRGGTPVKGGSSGPGGAAGSGAAGSGGAAGATCPGLAPNEELIDDMNDGDRYIPQVNGRAGAWKDNDDGTPGAKMFPPPAGPFIMTDTGDVCRQYAAYVYGGPFVDSGASFGFGLGSPYNATAYTGISFWAKIDSGTSPGLRVSFPDKDTQPDGGLCQANGAGATQCYDHYGSRITLTTDWTKYEVYFSSVTQDGWGRLGAAFDPSTLYEVQFEIPVDATFGIWVDDVAFLLPPSQ